MDYISIAIANLNKCGDAIEKENVITDEMLKDFLLSSKSPVLKVEDNLLEMASSGSTDSIFYCTALQLPSNGPIYARFFESGGFSGFFRNVAHNKLKETLNVDIILPYQVYTDDDIRVDASRSQKLYSSLKKDTPNKRNQSDRSYARNLKTNTKSICNIINNFIPSIESGHNTKCLFLCLYVMYRIQKFESTSDDNRRNGPADTYRTARVLLEKCCEQILNNGGIDLDLNSITNCLDEYSKAAFLRMVSNSIDDKEKKSLATFFKLLSSDSSVDTIIPLRFCDDITQFIDTVNQRIVSMQELRIFIYKSKFFCPELSNLILSSALAHDQLPHADIVQLLQYLVYFVRNIHSYDEPAVDPEPIPGTYNPAKYGRAYYFNAHGCQVRKIREFSIDKKKDVQQRSIFDDKPDLPCDKRYPVVSKKGITYAFLWFCPLHGHCYGYHIIPGSEGRKDPSASLLTHSNVAPDDILYDFACSLSEYTKNRESGFFAKTRFFHDVFHGYVHKCTSAFKCNRLLGTNAINSSICEQFNSYIQKIKRSSKLMSQNHFALYLQFFIHIWNQKKKNSFQKKLNIAASGRQELPNNPL